VGVTTGHGVAIAPRGGSAARPALGRLALRASRF
jgi:hypothetical protein